MDLQLTGKVAIVTGASRGLGRAAARALLDEGACVLATARSADALARLAETQPDRCHGAVVDLRDVDAVQDLVRVAVQRFGRLDIVVNNAGIGSARPFLEVDSDHFRDVLDVNVVAPGVLAAAAAAEFVNQGTGGKIINVASIAAIRGKASLAEYSASKGALVLLTKALSAEWARHDIQVNAIAPGVFATEMQKDVTGSKELSSRRLREVPAGRWANPDEIGALVCYLASPLSNFVTGATFVIDGGEIAKF